ncbi:MAG TPA: DUF5703 domain-containing protein, partial [Puia sp.]
MTRTIAFLWSFLSFLTPILAQTELLTQLDSCNVSWNEPGPGPAESMPIGNGDIGLNVWVEKNGD